MRVCRGAPRSLGTRPLSHFLTSHRHCINEGKQAFDAGRRFGAKLNATVFANQNHLKTVNPERLAKSPPCTQISLSTTMSLSARPASPPQGFQPVRHRSAPADGANNKTGRLLQRYRSSVSWCKGSVSKRWRLSATASYEETVVKMKATRPTHRIALCILAQRASRIGEGFS